MNCPFRFSPLALAVAASFAATTLHAIEPGRVLALSQKHTPAPPWAAGDERGMANALGQGTWMRCAWHLSQPKARAYEVSQVRSNSMPLSPFTGPYAVKPKPMSGIPGTAHGFNSETLNEGAEPGQQGTQMDAIGHFAYFRQPWDGKPPFPAENALYYGGYAQKDVPRPLAAQARHGEDPADRHQRGAARCQGAGRRRQGDERGRSGHGKASHGDARGAGPRQARHPAGRRGVGAHRLGRALEGSRHRQGLLPMAPGLSYDAAQYPAQKRIVAIALDTPFIDPAAEGALAGKAGPAPGTPSGLPFAVHHHMLTQAGIHHIKNAKLDEMARDKVWTSCAMILPLLEKGAAGSAVRPVAIGVPGKVSESATIAARFAPGPTCFSLRVPGHGPGRLVAFTRCRRPAGRGRCRPRRSPAGRSLRARASPGT
jgi:hypothetical protein